MIDVDKTLKLALEDRLNQRQDSIIDQLNDLILIANKLKMYDAADYIQNVANR